MTQPAKPSGLVRFGVFEIDLAKAELRKHGLRIRIQEQPLQVLAALLENPGEVVSRDELVQRLWPEGTFVDFDRGLNAAVNRLRRTLSDSAENPRYVETVARQGYRFVMPVESLATRNGATSTPPGPAIGPPDVNVVPPSHDRWRSVLRKAFGMRRLLVYGASVGFLALAGFVLTARRSPSPAGGPALEQITDFTDAAIAPAISPDGRTVAFIRGADWFLSSDQIWLKSLPDGEPVRLTNDPRPKFAPTFSPDGSRLAYSVVEPSRTAWDTLTVPVLGGDPRLLLANAEGLTWISKDEVLFSEIKKGIHMGVVTAREDRSHLRDVYLPEHERAMAHFSYLSPDGKWVLLIEMDETADWQPCRLVPFDGTSKGRQVGPRGRCTSAGWSPDGKWMYFTVATTDGQHLWRQRFPDGAPEQVTSGPAEAQGVAISADGRSLITSMGMQHTAIWIHDSGGERSINSVGNAYSPKFSPDGRRLFYLLRRSTPHFETELWEVDLKSGRTQRLVSGHRITGYDISDGGSEVVFATQPAPAKSEIWLASLDGRSPPVQIAANGEDDAYFGRDGYIFYRVSDGSANYLWRMNRDGSGRVRVVQRPILNVMGISPDRQWIAALVAVDDKHARFAEVAIPVQGGAPKRICSGYCVARWAPDGKFFYISLEPGWGARPGKTMAIPIPTGSAFPHLPRMGISSLADGLAVAGSSVIEHADFAPGLNPSTYAYVKTSVHRNLFRVRMP